jgi:phenylalanyl-tRNA synthetase beta chain
VEELGAGEIAKGEIDILAEDLTPRTVKTTAAGINALLGTNLIPKQMKGYLEKAFIATDVAGDELTCSIPLFRQDIAGGADIAEEVARMYGYDNIDAAPMLCEVRGGGVSETERATDKIKEYMADAGYTNA